MDNIILESAALRCEFSRETGALVGLASRATGWKIMECSGLGLSFRLLVPLGEELRNNNVCGEQQRLSSYTEEAGKITFRWDGVDSERGGFLPVNVTMEVAPEGAQIVYRTKIENNSAYVVESVYAPYVGDVRPPEGAAWLKTFIPGYSTAYEASLWPEYHNHHGYHGVDYPTQLQQGSPMCPFFLIRSEKQGLYAGLKAASAEPVAWGTELRPGWDSSINALVPKAGEIAGKPVCTRFAAVHMPYIQPGETREITPIALEAFTGGWQAGADIYKKWRETWMTPAEPPEWAKNPHSWQQLHINSPEDELRMRFTELPGIAEECKKYGVAAIQLVGWNDGGQDQGNPSHDPDPRLGTFAEMKDAIRRCHEIGVKIILFSKFTWADRATEWFREKLKGLATTDPYGDYYMHGGYRYQTPAQLLDINTKRLIPMCFLSEEYRKICDAEFKKLVELGAAGMLFDECLHHGPALLCFNKNHGHRYAAPAYQEDRALISRFRDLPGTPAEFLMAGESLYDWEFDAYQLSYHRSENKRYIPLQRYLLPNAQIMTAVTGFNDRNMVNQCLMLRYVISYEPFNFKGRLSDYPDTVEYGKKMDALRTEYRKWFWDGEFRDTLKASVTDEKGEKHPTYSVFRADDGSLGLVVCNYEDAPVKVAAAADDGYEFSRFRLVEEGAEIAVDFPGGDFIEIPARSAVIVI